MVVGGGQVDEAALEGKDPKVIAKQNADIELSLNGGIDKNADPDAIENNDPLQEDHDSVSNDDTPSYNEDYYNNPGNKVVEPGHYRQNKSVNLPPKEFPNGHFN